MIIPLKQLKKMHCTPPNNKRVHCKSCRTNSDFRKKITGLESFQCPYGITMSNFELPMNNRCLAGTELKKLLSYFKIKNKHDCKCSDRAEQMDAMGCDWCKKNKETITRWLKEEAKKRNLPFSKFFVDKLIDIAIKRALKKSHSH